MVAGVGPWPLTHTNCNNKKKKNKKKKKGIYTHVANTTFEHKHLERENEEAVNEHKPQGVRND